MIPGRKENLIWGDLAFYGGSDSPLETMLYYVTLISL